MTSERSESPEIPDELTAEAVLNEKLTDLLTPGCIVEFDPDEAERLGAFEEDALSEAEALESSLDLQELE
jgi:hypothetical protein